MSNADRVLRELVDKIIVKLNLSDAEVKIKPITSGGANYTSVLYLVDISEKEKKYKLFAKVAIVGDKMRKIINATTIFGTEVYVYTDLMKMYCSIQDKFDLEPENRFVFPKFYGFNPNMYEETIVLENLIAKGFKSFDRFNSIEWEYAASAMSVLAKFHALSFAYEKESPKEFETVIKNLQFIRQAEDEGMKQVWRNMTNRALAVLNEDQRAKVKKMFEGNDGDHFEKYNRPRGKAVLIHGDFRPSNLLFKKEDDKVTTIAVDYQTVRSGCPATDLVYFIAIGSDGAFRAAHMDRLTEFYYNELLSASKRLDVDAATVYPREEFEDDLKAMLPYCVFLGIAVLPIITVESDQAPRVDGDADCSHFVLEPNQLFAARFTELISDCERWGVI